MAGPERDDRGQWDERALRRGRPSRTGPPRGAARERRGAREQDARGELGRTRAHRDELGPHRLWRAQHRGPTGGRLQRGPRHHPVGRRRGHRDRQRPTRDGTVLGRRSSSRRGFRSRVRRAHLGRAFANRRGRERRRARRVRGGRSAPRLRTASGRVRRPALERSRRNHHGSRSRGQRALLRRRPEAPGAPGGARRRRDEAAVRLRAWDGARSEAGSNGLPFLVLPDSDSCPDDSSGSHPDCASSTQSA